jgi:hypothetical protein
MAALRRCSQIAVLCWGAMALLGVGAAPAATFSADSAATLMTAVNEANAATGSSTITLAAGVSYLPPVTLTFSNRSGTTTVEGQAITPSSPSTRRAALGGASVMPFPSDLVDVLAGARVDFENVTIAGAGGSGGYPAINDFGSVVIDDSTMQGDDGPSLLVQSGASATLRDSTIGQGLDFGIVDDGTASLFNSTVAYNLGGVDDSSGKLNLTNSIVADNARGDCLAPVSANGGSDDHSLDSDGSCGTTAPLSGVNPLLASDFQAPLVDGAGVPIYPLQAGSPAIGAGDESQCPAADERGYPTNSPCDLGAAAYAASAPAARSGGPGSAGSSSPSSPAVGYDGLQGRGTIASARRRPAITFMIRVSSGRRSGIFDYTDRSRRLRLRVLAVRSVVIDDASDSATVRGVAVNAVNGRRVRFSVLADCGRGRRRFSVRLSSGYSHGGAVVHGSLSLTSL